MDFRVVEVNEGKIEVFVDPIADREPIRAIVEYGVSDTELSQTGLVLRKQVDDFSGGDTIQAAKIDFLQAYGRRWLGDPGRAGHHPWIMRVVISDVDCQLFQTRGMSKYEAVPLKVKIDARIPTRRRMNCQTADVGGRSPPMVGWSASRIRYVDLPGSLHGMQQRVT